MAQATPAAPNNPPAINPPVNLFIKYLSLNVLPVTTAFFTILIIPADFIIPHILYDMCIKKKNLNQKQVFYSIFSNLMNFLFPGFKQSVIMKRLLQNNRGGLWITREAPTSKRAARTRPIGRNL